MEHENEQPVFTSASSGLHYTSFLEASASGDIAEAWEGRRRRWLRPAAIEDSECMVRVRIAPFGVYAVTINGTRDVEASKPLSES